MSYSLQLYLVLSVLFSRLRSSIINKDMKNRDYEAYRPLRLEPKGP